MICEKCKAPTVIALAEPGSKPLAFDPEPVWMWRIYDITIDHKAAVAYKMHTLHVCKKGESE